MTRSFYHYLMTLRGPELSDPITAFANHVGADHQFPKHSQEYHEISDYLEMTVDYLPSMDIFDQAWTMYLENNR